MATVVAGYYAATQFAISTDINTLISEDIDWRQREIAFEKSFPGRHESILAVVDAPTPEVATQAAAALAETLKAQPKLFKSVQYLAGTPFFREHGLLFLPTAEVESTADGLAQARPIVGILNSDPSLRGLSEAMGFPLLGVQRGALKVETLAQPMTMAAETLEAALAGRPAHFSWQSFLQGKAPERSETSQFIEILPILDYAALEPGRAATDAIRQAAAGIDLFASGGARVRLTGSVPIADEEFSTVREGAFLHLLVTVVAVLGVLWPALRSGKIILAVALSLTAGLALTAAGGLALVGSLNLISIAFAVLFIGLGVDFGIQLAVRYRAERHKTDDLHGALAAAAEGIGVPLTLAAGAIAAGFLSFVPTDYRGVSELGQIAGLGMAIAFLSSITLLPALLAVLNPRGEPEAVGYKWLAPVDGFLQRHRMKVVLGTIGVTVLSLPLLAFLRFDFNPINLRSPDVESIATFLDLRRDPNLGANAVNVILPPGADASPVVKRLSALPEVARVQTLQNFVPEDQDKKLAAIRKLAEALREPFAEPAAEPPTDQDNVEGLRSLAELITDTAEKAKAQGPAAAAAKRLVAALTALADGDKAQRDRAEAALVWPLKVMLADLQSFLKAGPVTLENLPPGLVSHWVGTDGRGRVEALPAGDPNDNETLRRFARAVVAVYPEAVGGPIAILKSGDTIVWAFIQAGVSALIVITLLLWLALRRLSDVALTLTPLLIAGAATLQLCVLLGIPLNFANIIALPLLFGLGVAFTIYYTMAWREGQTDLLQASLTRAVISSGLTTGAAFGSLWLSSHPGTSSMGKLLALSLMATLLAAVLFQPALLGAPRGGSRKP